MGSGFGGHVNNLLVGFKSEGPPLPTGGVKWRGEAGERGEGGGGGANVRLCFRLYPNTSQSG